MTTQRTYFKCRRCNLAPLPAHLPLMWGTDIIAQTSQYCRACRMTDSLGSPSLAYWPKIATVLQDGLCKDMIPLDLQRLLDLRGASYLTDGTRVWWWGMFPSQESLRPSDLSVFLLARRGVRWLTTELPQMNLDLLEVACA